ncbi:MAG: class I SAM-dependent methyltransferase [Terrimicrobiaceae bacterium]|nr:class I SAM-dependent methyltransferase [Terrimicrobiaceae bacterium]
MEKAIAGIDSVVAFTNTSGIKGRGTLVHISRSVAVFEVYNPYSIIQLSEVLQELSVMRGERVIYRGRGVVTSIVTTGLMVIVSVTLIDSWNALDHLEPGPELGGAAEHFIRDWEEGQNLSENYQLVVNKFANFLAEASRWIEEAETAIIGSVEVDEDRAARFRDSIQNPVALKLKDLIGAFEVEAARVPDEESALYKAFARREIHPFMLCAPFAWRSFYKPLGYAGDYEMVNMMLQESPSVGNNTYARIFHDLTTSVAACLAHRNRITILERLLAEEAGRVTDEQRIFTVLTVACGPAVEIQRFIRNHDLANQSALHLMDFNEETLEYVKQRMSLAMSESGRKPAIKFIQKSIDDLLKDVHLESEGFLPAYDMIYCAGLFDYFPDNVCRNLLQLYYRWVRPGGLLVATNVHPNNPERGLMEHLLEWYLIYRDEKHLESLAPKGSSPEVFADETGVNVFLTSRKPG